MSDEDEYGDDDYLNEDGDYERSDNRTHQQQLLVKLGAQFLTSFISSPYHVVSVLLSIQHLQRPHFISTSDGDGSNALQGDSDTSVDSIDFDETTSSQHGSSPVKSRITSSSGGGYILPTHRPEYQLKPMRGTYWNSIKALTRHKHEGFLSLWKGFLPTFTMDLTQSLLQPWLEDQLNDYWDLFDNDVMPLAHQPSFWPNLTTLVVSHAVTNLILVPMEVVRVRLIAQSSDPLHRSFNGHLHALVGQKPLTLKNVLRSLYPTYSDVMYHTFVPLISQTQALVIRRFLRISQKTDPATFALASFMFMTLELIITLPWQTVRRRRMLFDSHGAGIKAKTPAVVKYPCVSIQDRDYAGTLSGLVQILRLEALGAPPTIKKRRRGTTRKIGWRWGFLGGIGQLYRGFWFHTTSNLVLCCLGMISGLDIFGDSDPYYF
jgi:fusion and transport protein UGO1